MRIRVPDLPSLPAPNVTALIDILMLLLVFFMMGGQFGQREEEEVRLPRGLSLTSDCGVWRLRHLVINVYHRTDRTCRGYARREGCMLDEHWLLDIKGQDCTKPRALAQVLEKETAAHDDLRVLLRADEAAPFGRVQQALQGCSAQGLYRVKVLANQIIEPSVRVPVQIKSVPSRPAPKPRWIDRFLWPASDLESSKEAGP